MQSVYVFRFGIITSSNVTQSCTYTYHIPLQVDLQYEYYIYVTYDVLFIIYTDRKASDTTSRFFEKVEISIACMD